MNMKSAYTFIYICIVHKYSYTKLIKHVHIHVVILTRLNRLNLPCLRSKDWLLRGFVLSSRGCYTQALGCLFG